MPETVNTRFALGGLQLLNGVFGVLFVLGLLFATSELAGIAMVVLIPLLLACLMLLLGIFVIRGSLAAGWGSACIHLFQLVQFSGEPLELSFDAGLKYVVWYAVGEASNQLVGLNLVSLVLLSLSVRYVVLLNRMKGKDQNSTGQP